MKEATGRLRRPIASTSNLIMAGCGNVILPHFALPASMSNGGVSMSTPRSWSIYVLIDPRTSEVRYVGWAFDVRQRWHAHVSSAPRTRSHKANWIKQLLALGLRPIYQVIEEGTGDWREAERRWIDHYRRQGAALTNMTDGGEGTPGLYPSEETRAKMSRAHTGRKMPPAAIAKTAAALRGRKQSPEHIEKLSAARKGKAPWPATNAAAEVMRGRKQSPDHVEKRIGALRGRSRPEQCKKPIIIDGVEYWRCSACGACLPASGFRKQSRTANGLDPHCRECAKERERRYQ